MNPAVRFEYFEAGREDHASREVRQLFLKKKTAQDSIKKTPKSGRDLKIVVFRKPETVCSTKAAKIMDLFRRKEPSGSVTHFPKRGSLALKQGTRGGEGPQRESSERKALSGAYRSETGFNKSPLS